jgi:hypothetical protein
MTSFMGVCPGVNYYGHTTMGDSRLLCYAACRVISYTIFISGLTCEGLWARA